MKFVPSPLTPAGSKVVRVIAADKILADFIAAEGGWIVIPLQPTGCRSCSCRAYSNRHYSWDCTSHVEQKSVETNTVEPILYSKNSVEQNIVDVNIVDSIIELILDLNL